MTFNIALYLLAGIALIYSFRRDRQKTKRALQSAKNSFLNMLPMMLGIIGLIGVILVLIPQEVIGGLFGGTNPLGMLLISIVGAVTLIPAFIAFPFASSLMKAGASTAAVALFITTLLMVGVITLPLEIKFFGKKFTLWRNALSFLLAIVIALLMGVILQ